MFATLLGALPWPTGPDGRPLGAVEHAVVVALEAQALAGLDPLTDGRLGWRGAFSPIAGLEGVAELDEASSSIPTLHLVGRPSWRGPLTVEGWRFAAGHAAALVKQSLPGPYTLGRRLGADDRDDATAAFADALRLEVMALADAGCAFIEIEERDAGLIGADPLERRRFADAHSRLLMGVDGVHVSLALAGSSAHEAGIETILAAPYPSLAVDLINGPDNWYLVRGVPGDRGVVCGALPVRADADEGPELLVWAAAYAASMNGRGIDRVGLATAGGLDHLDWPVAMRKMTSLGTAARLAAKPLDEAASELDPRMLDRRAGALDGRRPPSSGS